jgi:AraC family transcriptional regulator
MAKPGTWFTFRSQDVWMGEFVLPPGEPAWERPNRISEEAPLIAFPGTTVGIRQEGSSEVVADPTRAVLYRAGQPYRRRLVSGEGDRCTFVTFSHVLAVEAAARYDARASDPGSYRFPFTTSPITGADYTLVQRVRQAVARRSSSEAVRESLYWLIDRAVASGYAAARTRGADRRPTTARAHRDVAEAVREIIGADLSEQQTLDELARRVHLSPFHLARVFRDATGSSIHSYRTEVRLRASIRRIADGERIATVAADTGFASQAHLTDRFKRAYGASPNAWRLAMHESPEIRTIMKAREALALLA